MVGGIGDFIGEKLKTHKTGKEIYSEQLLQIQGSCAELQKKMLQAAEVTPPANEQQRAEYEKLYGELQALG